MSREPLALTAEISGDGLPKPRVQKALENGQTNGGVGRPIELRGSWLPYRGRGGVTFDDKGPTVVHDGKIVTNVHFSLPGTYILMAIGDDSELTSSKTITVDVVR